jgi:hypothetical protein
MRRKRTHLRAPSPSSARVIAHSASLTAASALISGGICRRGQPQSGHGLEAHKHSKYVSQLSHPHLYMSFWPSRSTPIAA